MPLFNVPGPVDLSFRPKTEEREEAVEEGTVWVSRLTWVVLLLLPFIFDSRDGFCDPA